MATVREIRGRIATVKKIEQVTSAMKMVAAARLRRASERAEAARPYADMMHAMLQNLTPSLQGFSHPLLQSREVRSVGVVVLSAERGLAGSYNANLMREVQSLSRSLNAPARYTVLGRKGVSFLKRRGFNVVYEASMPATEVNLGEVRAVAAQIRKDFEDGAVDEVYLVYSRFVSAMTQRPVALKLLPFEAPPASLEAPPPSSDIIFEPDATSLLSRLLPRYVDTQVYRAMTEAVASEHGARMTSMSSASDNAAEMIKGLTLTYNRVRQAAITKELAEIVGGAEALRQG
ncbi:MAG TPA: ATP synthase F1 subunit gamma [Armatimonadota bacterium]|jgi:F-type H+-transporting ATPase subunit gamma